MRKINLIPLFIACILSACLSPSEGDGSPDEPPTVTPTSSPTTVFTATPSQTLTPEPTPTLSPAEILDKQLQASGLFPPGMPENSYYTIGTDADGNTVAFDSSGQVILKGTLWNSEKIFRIVENMLKVTHDCEKAPINPEVVGTADQGYLNYITILRDKLDDKGIVRRVGQNAYGHFFKSQNNCMGFLQGKQESRAEIFFWANLKGNIQFVRLFNPESEN